MEESTGKEFDIIVIGCGLSGMTAAYEILKLDPEIKLCLLEAKGTNLFLFLHEYGLQTHYYIIFCLF